ncbi:MAG TPA: TIGR01459 family HAD-type hydrolase [Caulobacteraceae bacterium]|nr:TIGR01459 family HAD-type hydrolase [Caulobacteraceae bacterium]
MTRLIDGLACVASDYEILLCDVWGVVHNGRESFPAACAALERWRAARGPVLLISNSPRPGPEVAAQLDGLGVPRGAWTTIVTSGDATRGLLRARAPGPAWRIGPGRDDPLYEGLGLSFSNLESARFIACTGPNDDEVETPEDYRAVLTRAAARDLEMVCANPDRVVQRGERLIFCGGALADLYEHLGGRVAMAGKPYAPIYDLALTHADEALGRPHERSRILAIGDGLATDIAGAQAQRLDRLFVAAGIHGAEVRGADGRLSARAVDDLLAMAGLSADFAMGDLAW